MDNDNTEHFSRADRDLKYMKHIPKQKIIDMLRDEKWFPEIEQDSPRYLDMQVAERLNIILEDIVSRIISL